MNLEPLSFQRLPKKKTLDTSAQEPLSFAPTLLEKGHQTTQNSVKNISLDYICAVLKLNGKYITIVYHMKSYAPLLVESDGGSQLGSSKSD